MENPTVLVRTLKSDQANEGPIAKKIPFRPFHGLACSRDSADHHRSSVELRLRPEDTLCLSFPRQSQRARDLKVMARLHRIRTEAPISSPMSNVSNRGNPLLTSIVTPIPIDTLCRKIFQAMRLYSSSLQEQQAQCAQDLVDLDRLRGIHLYAVHCFHEQANERIASQGQGPVNHDLLAKSGRHNVVRPTERCKDIGMRPVRESARTSALRQSMKRRHQG